MHVNAISHFQISSQKEDKTKTKQPRWQSYPSKLPLRKSLKYWTEQSENVKEFARVASVIVYDLAIT